jgi:hypothetical protein
MATSAVLVRMSIARVLSAAFVLASLVGGTALAQITGGDGGRMRLTPEQRQQMWQQMTPEQREAFRAARTPEERQRAWQGLPPEQQREMWHTLTPEQRELMMRRVPSEERRQMWQKMSPEEREAMRQRFLQHREQRVEGEAPRRLTPEERQRMREQIREAQGAWKGPAKKGEGR